MPNFIIVGAAKAGTTSLYHYLKQHPQVFMSEVKETNFFVFEGQKLDFQGPRDMEFVREFSITSFDNYQKLFQKADGALAVGEVSPQYLYDPTAAANIYSEIPDVRLIAILRNPIDRAYSSFLMMRRDGREPLRSFSRAIQHEQNRKEQNWEYIWRYIEVGFYSNQLSRYYDLFKKDQILILFYEEFELDPVMFTKKIFKFIGVDDGFSPIANERYNVSILEKSSFAGRVLRSQGLGKRLARTLFPEELLESGYDALLGWNYWRPRLSKRVRKRLIDVYANDIRSLQEMLEVDLSHWLKP
jgi:hypothetical protein